MSGLALLKQALGSRFAFRTYLLFCVCALLPVVLFGAIGYVVVAGEMRANASERLAAVSKQYGLIVNERLIQAERALVEMARASIAGVRSSETTLYSDTRLADVALRELSTLDAVHGPGTSDGLSIVPTLRLIEAAEPGVVMEVSVRNGSRAVLASGTLQPSDLWDADAVALAGMTLCASAMGRQLTCWRSDEGAVPDAGQGKVLRERWTLFLKPRYGVGEWTLEASQPDQIALQGLHSFRILLLGTAGLACFGALLLSAVQIRRSHRPLRELVEAARLMGERRFDTRVKLKGNSEFAHLGRAFNHLAAGLQRQFRVLRAFSRIDRQILGSPEIEPLARALLPRVSRLLRARVVVLMVKEAETSSACVYSHVAGTPAAVTLQRVDVDSPAAMIERSVSEWLPFAEQPAAVDLQWKSSPIVVQGTVRGIIAVARSPVSHRQDDGRHLLGLARRVAVALGNEDRERALLRQAYFDSLTALPNRQLFKDRLDQEILRCKRDDGRVVLFFIDLDHFKNVNDSLGHSAGDELLQAAANRLQLLLRSGDTLARLGGDEFTLVAPNLDDAAAETLARAMIGAVGKPFALRGMQCVVQASIGIAVYPRDSDTTEGLVRAADTAMYRAKAQGRARAVFFEEAMNARVVRRLALEQRLRLAIEEGSLSLHYQPKFTAGDCRLVGVEALARWVDAELGPVSPAEFIPLAEECGLIEPLGVWCVNEACAAMRGWRDLGLPIAHVAVNVSMYQLKNPQFPRLLHQALQAHGLEPSDLEIEVTESMLAGNLQEVIGLLAAVQKLGVRVAIDDFGTGYSSMVALQQLPANIVKIDRAFVVGSDQPQGLALLRALIAAGHALGKEVVAEGVETSEQLEILRSCGCDVVQGYLLGKPHTAEELVHRLRRMETEAAKSVRHRPRGPIKASIK
jgi:diguanylate cyclase (GGDEF)-like protein